MKLDVWGRSLLLKMLTILYESELYVAKIVPSPRIQKEQLSSTSSEF